MALSSPEERAAQFETLLDVTAGTALTPEQAATLDSFVTMLMDGTREQRGQLLLSRDRLVTAIGLFLRQFPGIEIKYAEPFASLGFGSARSQFDIVATWGDEVSVVEVRDNVTSRDLEQIKNYLGTFRTLHPTGKLFLGTDVLNWPALLFGPLCGTVAELAAQEGMGVILADEEYAVICETWQQVTMESMPQFLFTEQSEG